MLELLLFGGVVMVGIALLVAAFAVLGFFVRALLWLVLFPIKLAFALVGGIVALAVALAVGALVLVPLLPLVLLGVLVWALVKATRPIPA